MHAGPALGGSDDDALIDAMRNLWPLLSPESRREAIRIAEKTKDAD